MCGIAGIVSLNGQLVKNSALQKMLAAMKHRGPDDEGTYVDENIGLGHVRLSIIDLTSAGHQPFISNDHRYILVYNGEIYNYIELREQLQGKGYQFNTNSDTEVLLYAFMEWGEECLDRFNGMWAFAIYDKFRKILFGARDRYGVKPFYYIFNSKYFIFASDIPPILSQLEYRPSPNKQIIFDYLAFSRTDHIEDTFFESIRKFQHGHSFSLNIASREFKIKRWYNLHDKIKEPFCSSGDFFDALQQSVKLRLRSDVPVGVCLSGGIDSSSIVSLLTANLNQKNINTFSAVYNMKHRANEKAYIDLVNVKNKFFIYPSENEFISDIPRLIKAQSEPFPTSAIYAQFKVMEYAKKYVTVLLDGQGADEYLAGYHYFFGYYFYELFNKNQYLRFHQEILRYIKNYSFNIGLKYFIYLLAPNLIKELIISDKTSLIDKNVLKQYIRTTQVINDLHYAKSVNDACLNHFEYKLEHLLKWEDRNSMFFSLESRVPFLDFNLVERIIGGPVNQKISKGWTKVILRDAMKYRLNEKIRLRKDKVGFATPEDIWLKSKEFRSLTFEMLSSKHSIGNEFMKKTNVDTDMNILSKDPRSSWKWINLYLWEKQYYGI